MLVCGFVVLDVGVVCVGCLRGRGGNAQFHGRGCPISPKHFPPEVFIFFSWRKFCLLWYGCHRHYPSHQAMWIPPFMPLGMHTLMQGSGGGGGGGGMGGRSISDVSGSGGTCAACV